MLTVWLNEIALLNNEYYEQICENKKGFQIGLCVNFILGIAKSRSIN